MKHNLTKEDWFGILGGLFFDNFGNDNFDESDWLQDFTDGKDPVAAFYDEFPELDIL